MSVVQELKVRRAEFKDVDAIATIHARSKRDAMPWLAIVHTALEDRAYFRVQLKQQDCYVAVAGGAIVAYAIWHDGWLNHLYVHSASQRAGVGSLLFGHARRAMSGGFRFWVFQRNLAARAFYEKQGATLVRETDGQANDEREPDAEYQWMPR